MIYSALIVSSLGQDVKFACLKGHVDRGVCGCVGCVGVGGCVSMVGCSQ